MLRVHANRVEAGAARGGRLYLTNRRLVFEPHDLEVRLTDAAFFQLSVDDLVVADVAPRTWNRLDGGLRRRLRIRTRSGDAELFVVWRPAKVAAEINARSSRR